MEPLFNLTQFANDLLKNVSDAQKNINTDKGEQRPAGAKAGGQDVEDQPQHPAGDKDGGKLC